MLIVIRYLYRPDEDRVKAFTPFRFGNGLLGPLVGLFAARDGHEMHMLDPIGPHAAAGTPASEAGVANQVVETATVAGTDWHVCYVTLYSKPGKDLPMDWVLSESVKAYMRERVQKSDGIKSVLSLLKSSHADLSQMHCDDKPPQSPDIGADGLAEDKSAWNGGADPASSPPASSASFSNSMSVSGSPSAPPTPAAANPGKANKPGPVNARPVRHHTAHAVARHHHRR